MTDLTQTSREVVRAGLGQDSLEVLRHPEGLRGAVLGLEARNRPPLPSVVERGPTKQDGRASVSDKLGQINMGHRQRGQEAPGHEEAEAHPHGPVGGAAEVLVRHEPRRGVAENHQVERARGKRHQHVGQDVQAVKHRSAPSLRGKFCQ